MRNYYLMDKDEVSLGDGGDCIIAEMNSSPRIHCINTFHVYFMCIH